MAEATRDSPMGALQILRLNQPQLSRQASNTSAASPAAAALAISGGYGDFPGVESIAPEAPPDEMEMIERNMSQIQEILLESGAELVSVISVMGAWRTGKSFFLSFLLRFLDVLEKEHAQGKTDLLSETTSSDWKYWSGINVPTPAWRNFDAVPGREDLHAETPTRKLSASTGFAWRGGTDETCTNGLWIYPKPFMFTGTSGQFTNKRIAVLVMDTQGAWDPKLTGGQNMTIAGLTTLLSSKLIYNNMSRINADKIDQLDLFCQVARKAGLRAGDRNHQGNKSQVLFGDLIFLIRDWAGFKKNDDMNTCQEKIQKHLRQTFEETKKTDREAQVTRIEAMFRQKQCFGMCAPGRDVAENEDYTGEMDLINPDFLVLLDEALRTILGGDFPNPSAPLGLLLKAKAFDTTFTNLLSAFRAANNDTVARGLRDTMIHAELYLTNNELLNEFTIALNKRAPVHAVMERGELDEIVKAILEDFVSKFNRLMDETFGEQDQMEEADTKLMEEASNKFRQTLQDATDARVEKNQQYIAGGQMKLVATVGVSTGVLWLRRHPYVSVIAMGGYGAVHAGNASERAEAQGGTALDRMAQDWKEMLLDRHWRRDISSMWVAVRSLSKGHFKLNVQPFVKAVVAAANLQQSSNAGNAAANNNNNTNAPAVKSV